MNHFLTATSLNRVSWAQLKLFRWALGFVCLYSFAQYLFLHDIYFSGDGIGTFILQQQFSLNGDGSVLSGLALALDILAIVASIAIIADVKTRWAALICAVIQALYCLRNPWLTHFGDKYLLFLLPMAFFIPWERSEENHSTHLQGPTVLALKFQILVIYSTNLFLKVYHGWLQNSGMKAALNEPELQTSLGRWLLQHPSLVQILNLSAVLALVVLIALIFIPRLAWVYVLLAVGYHVSSYFMIRLDWLPVAALLPVFLFLPERKSATEKNLHEQSTAYACFLALSVVWTIMFHSQAPNEFEQLWRGYAPPTSHGGTVQTTVATKHGEVLSFKDGEGLTSETNNLRHYKFFHRLSAEDERITRLAYARYLCDHLRPQEPVEVSIQYHWSPLFADSLSFKTDPLGRFPCPQ